MTSPKISVLMPVRDEAHHLPAALTSLTRQTFDDWELIAVDDGSQDATLSILQKAANADQRIKVFKRPPAGLVASLNFGLERCRASLVARMDGDDICHPQRLERQYVAMQQDPKLDLLGCCVRHFPRPRLQAGMLAYEKWQNALLNQAQIERNLFVESPFAHPSVMYHKQKVTDLGGYRDMAWVEDYDLWLRMAETGARFARLPQTLLYWRDRPQRLTRTADNCSLDAFRRCKAHFLRRRWLADVGQVWLWGAGMEGKFWRKILNETGIEVSGWIDIDPRKIGQQIHRARVIAPEQIPIKHPPILICVGVRGARQQIRDYCNSSGLVEGQDYICVT